MDDTKLVDELVKNQDLNRDRFVHLDTSLSSRRVLAVVDYNNDGHNCCAVRALRKKGRAFSRRPSHNGHDRLPTPTCRRVEAAQ